MSNTAGPSRNDSQPRHHWFHEVAPGIEIGPLTLTELVSAIREGKLRPDDPVRREDQTKSVRAGSALKKLFDRVLQQEQSASLRAREREEQRPPAWYERHAVPLLAGGFSLLAVIIATVTGIRGNWIPLGMLSIFPLMGLPLSLCMRAIAPSRSGQTFNGSEQCPRCGGPVCVRSDLESVATVRGGSISTVTTTTAEVSKTCLRCNRIPCMIEGCERRAMASVPREAKTDGLPVPLDAAVCEPHRDDVKALYRWRELEIYPIFGVMLAGMLFAFSFSPRTGLAGLRAPGALLLFSFLLVLVKSVIGRWTFASNQLKGCVR